MWRHRDRLEQRRKALGLTQAEVAAAIGCRTRTYMRYESGESEPMLRTRPRLAEALGVSMAHLAVLLDGDDAQAPNGQQVPKDLTLLASLEQGAAELRAYEPRTVYALLQTQAYASAVERSDVIPRTEEGVARRVELRQLRQQVLTRQLEPLRFSVILDESVLRRVTGGPDVMAEQLDHLVEVADLPSVDLRVFPFSAGQHPVGASSPFLLLTSHENPAPFMVCLGDRTGLRYIENDDTIASHVVLFNYLIDHALSPTASIDHIRRISKETFR